LRIRSKHNKVSGTIRPPLHCLISCQLLWLASYCSTVAMECFW